MKRAARIRGRSPRIELFVNRRGSAVRKNTYQKAISRAGGACGFRATSHLLRASFGCWLLARLEHLAKQGAAINPLLIVKILMGHKKARKHFVDRHHLPAFALSAIRPGVFTAFYRLSGDLRQAKEVANHAHLSTTVSYVQGPEVKSQNQERVAALQGAFLGHIEGRIPAKGTEPSAERQVPRGPAVSMFGFDCKDPLAGMAPGTRTGELCTHYLGCFTCPNAVITGDPASLARLVQARDHLRLGNTYIHPARWDAIYAPQLRILEEDILTRFSARELTVAAALCPSLPSLPQLR
jgi:hypothetical protein